MEGKKKNNSVWLVILLIIVLIITTIILVYNEVNENNKVLGQNEKLSSNSLSENEIYTRNERIKDYIKRIYPLPTVEYSYETITFPTFNTIEEANKDWIITVAYDNIRINRDEVYVYRTELETMINTLFGKINFNIEEYLKEGNGFENYEEKYAWLGQEGSLDAFSQYLIKTIKDISSNTFEVEIVECIEKPIWEEDEGIVGREILDIKGNKLKEFMYYDGTEYNDYIKEYLEKNSNNLPTKVLTLKYNQNDEKFFIISSRVEETN